VEVRLTIAEDNDIIRSQLPHPEGHSLKSEYLESSGSPKTVPEGESPQVPRDMYVQDRRRAASSSPTDAGLPHSQGERGSESAAYRW